MNIFNNANSRIKKAATVIRSTKVAEAPKPKPLPSKIASSKPRPQVQRATSSTSTTRAPSNPRSSGTPDVDRNRLAVPEKKRKALRQRSPARQQFQRLESDSSDDDSSVTEFEGEARKRVKLDREVDTNRRLRSKKAFSEENGGIFEMIHAADVVSSTRKSKLPAEVTVENVTVELKYPSCSQRERYDLVFGKDKIDPTEEIIEIAKIVTDVYLKGDQKTLFMEPNSGIIRQLEKSKNLLSRDIMNKELLDNFKIAVDSYNSAIEKLVKAGSLSENLDSMHYLPLNMIRCILRQVYDRAVSPKVDLLKAYENGTDNVYGELLPPFVSRILAETGLKSDHVFVDLGSGVGNVVLQAALEFGCESWGCEMMENACLLADAQEKEFAARCRLWGLRAGRIRLEKGDFLQNESILKAMRKADVILVNNQAFTPQLNQSLIDLFLDLKDGCRIVSLKSFVPQGHQITARTQHNPVNLLDVRQGEYHSDSVSWTDASGTYFMATKDSKRLQAFAERR